MSHPARYLAIDLGAESGRALLGQFDGRRLEVCELRRFPNGPVRLLENASGQDRLSLHWDVLRLWTEIKEALSLAVRQHGEQLASIGLDTWGVDFGLLDRQGALISNPYHYRDSRTDGMMEEAFRRMPRAEIFELTGLQFMQFNTLFQLLAMAVKRSPALDVAETLLTMPDLFNYWLTGRKVSEFSVATTTQCYDPRRGTWADPLLAALGIPRRLFGELVESGTRLGLVSRRVAEEAGAGPLTVIAPACHDTGSAVAAVPAAGSDFVWISSGTWSIMGTELPAPVITGASLACNFTNEGGVGHTFRFCKNIAALWLAQECRRVWAAQGAALSYAELTRMAAEARPFLAVLDTDDREFLEPGDMPGRIRAFCRRTGQAEPHSQGEIMRCILESLALKYRWVLERLEELVGRRLEPIHIVGGGAQNQVLNQFTADATGHPVVAGPVEATAIGNLLTQAIALGHVGSVHEARAVVRGSVAPQVFEPAKRAGWDEAFGRLLDVMAQHSCLEPH